MIMAGKVKSLKGQRSSPTKSLIFPRADTVQGHCGFFLSGKKLSNENHQVVTLQEQKGMDPSKPWKTEKHASKS